MRTSVPQIFEEVEKASSRQDKIKVFRAYDHPVMRGLLQINFNPNVKMDLPAGEPPFKKDKQIPVGYSETNLFQEFRRMYIWLDPNTNVNKFRKEQLFIQLLEGVHWSEAEDLCLAKDRKLHTKYKSIKEDLVREAFPDLLPPPAPKEEKVKEPPAKKSRVSLKG